MTSESNEAGHALAATVKASGDCEGADVCGRSFNILDFEPAELLGGAKDEDVAGRVGDAEEGGRDWTSTSVLQERTGHHRRQMTLQLITHLDLFAAGAGESFTRRLANRMVSRSPSALAFPLRVRFFGRAAAASRSPGSNT